MSRFLRTFEANPPKRHGKMDKQIELSQTEIELAFASFCIEGTARKLGQPYQEVFARMKRVGMIENYILPNYDILHTESREHVIDNIDVTYFRHHSSILALIMDIGGSKNARRIPHGK